MGVKENDGVSADSDDETDPLDVKNEAKTSHHTNGAEIVSGDVIPVEVLDDDGAPVTGSTVATKIVTSENVTAIPSDVPVNNIPDPNNPRELSASIIPPATVRPEDDDDLLAIVLLWRRPT